MRSDEAAWRRVASRRMQQALTGRARGIDRGILVRRIPAPCAHPERWTGLTRRRGDRGVPERARALEGRGGPTCRIPLRVLRVSAWAENPGEEGRGSAALACKRVQRERESV